MDCCVRTYEKRDLNGAIAIVTGANTGIGKETARELVKLGVNVIIGCRNKEKAENAVNDIKKSINEKNGKISYMLVDLSSFESVRKFVDDFKSKYDKLDILVNNAGLEKRNCPLTVDGYSLVYQTNYMSHFLLTHLLFPLLKKSKEARIVNLSSVTHRIAKAVYKESAANTAEHIYGESKLSTLLFTLELDRRLKLDNIKNVKVVAANPGAVRSDIWRNFGFISRFLINNLFLSTAQGCRSSIYGVVSDEIKGGEYISVYCSPFPNDRIEALCDTYGIFCDHSIMKPASICTNKLEEELFNWTMNELKINKFY